MSMLKTMMDSQKRAVKVAEQMCHDLGVVDVEGTLSVVRSDIGAERQGWNITITKPDGTTVGRFVPDHEEKKGQ